MLSTRTHSNVLNVNCCWGSDFLCKHHHIGYECLLSREFDMPKIDRVKYDTFVRCSSSKCFLWTSRNRLQWLYILGRMRFWYKTELCELDCVITNLQHHISRTKISRLVYYWPILQLKNLRSVNFSLLQWDQTLNKTNMEFNLTPIILTSASNVAANCLPFLLLTLSP